MRPASCQWRYRGGTQSTRTVDAIEKSSTPHRWPVGAPHSHGAEIAASVTARLPSLRHAGGEVPNGDLVLVPRIGQLDRADQRVPPVARRRLASKVARFIRVAGAVLDTGPVASGESHDRFGRHLVVSIREGHPGIRRAGSVGDALARASGCQRHWSSACPSINRTCSRLTISSSSSTPSGHCSSPWFSTYCVRASASMPISRRLNVIVASKVLVAIVVTPSVRVVRFALHGLIGRADQPETDTHPSGIHTSPATASPIGFAPAPNSRRISRRASRSETGP